MDKNRQMPLKDPYTYILSPCLNIPVHCNFEYKYYVLTV